MTDKLPVSGTKGFWGHWVKDIHSFNEFVKNRRRDERFPVLRFRQLEQSYLVASLFSVALCMATVDYWYANWISTGPPDKEGIFSMITPVGNSAWIFIVTGITIIAMSFHTARKYAIYGRFFWQRLYHTVTFFLLGVFASGAIALILKNCIGRERPNVALHHVVKFQPFSWQYEFASFPSGHAVTVGTLAFCIAMVFPRLRLPALCFGALVAVSRIMVEAHFPSDVLAGFLLGIAVTWYMALYFARMRLLFCFDCEGKPVVREQWKGNWKGMFASLAKPKRKLDRQ